MDTFRPQLDLTYYLAKDSHLCFGSPIFWFDKEWIKANKKHSKFVQPDYQNLFFLSRKKFTSLRNVQRELYFIKNFSKLTPLKYRCTYLWNNSFDPNCLFWAYIFAFAAAETNFFVDYLEQTIV